MKLRSIFLAVWAILLPALLVAATSTNTADLAGNFLTGVPYSGGETYILTAPNVAPTLAATGLNPTFLQGAGSASAVFTGAAAGIGAGDSGQTFNQFVFTVSNLADGSNEELTIDNTHYALTNGTSGLTIGALAGTNVSIAVAGGTATVTVSKSGLTAANIASLVNGISYRNLAGTPTNASARVFTITSLQDNGGTAGGGFDTATLSLVSTVTLVNKPTVTSPTSATVASSSVTLGGNVTSAGGGTITVRGVVVSLTSANASPQLSGTGVSDFPGTGTTGVFTVSATGLTATSGYSYAAYATNAAGTSYSSVGTFTTSTPTPGTLEIVSKMDPAAAGAPGTGTGDASTNPAVSTDGRYVAFLSNATNLVASQSTTGTHVYLRDRVANTTKLISGTGGSATTASGSCLTVSMSADGRYVSFTSNATALVSPATSLQQNFLYDRLGNSGAGSLTLVSHTAASPTASASGVSSSPQISRDGSTIVFLSAGSNLVSPYTVGTGSQLYRFDVATGAITLVSAKDGSVASATGLNAAAALRSVSDDGRWVLFASAASNAIASPGTTTGTNLYLLDAQAGTTRLLTRDASTPANAVGGLDVGGNVSSDGRYVTFTSNAATLVSGQTVTGSNQVFLYNRVADTLTLVSRSTSGATAGGNGATALASSTLGLQVMSRDGRFIALSSGTTDLVAGYIAGAASQFYLYDRLGNAGAGSLTLMTHATGSATTGTSGTIVGGVMSPDGSRFVFTHLASTATDLVAGVIAGNYTQIYAYTTTTGAMAFLSGTLADGSAGTSAGASLNPVASVDGTYLTFRSVAADLAANDSNGINADIFASVQPLVVITPEIYSPAAASATYGSAFSYTILATNTPTSYSVTGTLPTGLTIDTNTGIISGTPTPAVAGVANVTINAINSAGTSSAPLAITVAAIVPDAPTAAVATRGNGQASVAFTAPLSDGGAAITGYTVTSSPGNFTGTGATSPIVVSGLTNGTSYTFTVTATNSVGPGAASTASAAVTPATVPDAPTGAVATRGNAQASVAFTAPAFDGGSVITGYTVTSSPGGFTGTGTTSPIVVAGLTNGTGYTFTVTATNVIGTGAASTASASVTPATVPGAPTGVAASAGNTTTATVTFTAPAGTGGSAITGYTVTSSPGGLTGTGTTSPITVSGLTNGQAYTFTVTATNAVGTGAASTGSSPITIDTTPPTLTSVAIASNNPAPSRAKTGNTVTVTFTASEAVSLPTATVAGHAATVANVIGNTYTATTTMLVGDTEGTVAFSLSFADLAGNAGVAVTATTNASSVTFDKTVPTLSSVAIASNNATTSRAKTGDTVVVTFTASEAVATPTATVAGHVATIANTSGNTYTATTTMLAGDTEGVVTFSLAFSDLTGNAGTAVTATTNASSVTFDKTAPTLSSVAIASNNATTSRAKTGDTVVVSFTASEAVATPTATVAGHTATIANTSGNTYTATTTMLAGDTEGVVAFSLSFTDLTGNAGTAVTATTNASSVTFDKTAPALSSVAIASNNATTSRAKTGDTVVVTFTANEAVAAPTATVAGHAATVANTSGNTYTATTAMLAGDAEGAVTFSLSFTDLAGNAGTAVTTTTNASSVTFDKTVPTLASVSIASNNPNPIWAKTGNTVTVTFTTSEVVATPTGTVAGHAAAVANTSGNTYTATVTMLVGDTEGAVTFSLSFADTTGNAGTAVTATTNASAVTFDRTAPAAPAITAITTDTGSSSTDFITSDPTLVLSGTAEANSTVTLTRLTIGVLGTATANGAGVWSYDYTGTTLGVGDHTFTTTATDAAGNTGPASATLIVTVDTATAAPVIASITTDTGVSATDGITSDNTLTLTGTAEANSVVTLTRTGFSGPIGTATANGSGAWSFAYATVLVDGSYLFNAAAVDVAGNTSAASADFPVKIDTAAPAAPVIAAIASDTGSSATDLITKDPTLVLSGTAEANSVVTVTRVGTGVLGTATANGSGAWSYDYTATTLPEGVHTFTATSADAAGNVSPASANFVVTVDTTAPVVTSAATAPATYQSAFSYTIVATGAATSYGATGLPTGLAVNSATGAITGTPTQTGSFSITLSATDAAGNTGQAPLAVTIAQMNLTVAGITAASKVYDATTGATLTVAGATLVGVVSGDTVTLNTGSAAGIFGDKLVGSGKTVTVSGVTIGGASAANYTLTQPTATANITARALTVTGLAVTPKVYDASTVATLVTGGAVLVTVAGADNVTLVTAGATGAFATKSVGTAKTVTVAGLSLAGTDSGNYTLTVPVPTADITAKNLAVAGITAANKVYDRLTTANPTFTGAALVGIAGADTVTLVTAAATASFADKLVAAAKAVQVAGLALGGADAANYTLTQPATTADITAKPLTVSGVVAASRAYDTTTVAALTTTGAAAVGVVSGDTVTLSTSGAVGAFATKAVGTAKPVTISGLTIGGGDAANYTLTQPAATADITAKALTVTGITASSKSYDGTTSTTLTLSGAALSGVLGSDVVTLVTSGATGAFSDPNAGGAKIVQISGLSLTGADAANYALASPTTTASISPGNAVIAITGLSFTYDGTPKSATVTAAVPVTVTYAGSPTPPVNAGTYLVVATAANGNFAGSSSATLIIAKAPQTVAFSITGSNFNVGSTLGLTATASSGLPVTFSLVSGNATLAGSGVTITAVGAVTVRASQAGNDNYLPASSDQGFTGVAGAKTVQTIAFGVLSDHATTDVPFNLSATASSGLPVSFSIVSGPAFLTGSKLTLAGAPGTVVVRASQAGDATFAAAVDVTRSFVVSDSGSDTFFGDLLDDGLLGGAPGVGELLQASGPRLDAKSGDVAAVLFPGTRRGNIIVVSAVLGLNVSLNFTLNADGTYTIPFTSGGRPYTLSGSLIGSTLTGRIPGLRVSFVTLLQARGGITSDLAGFYESDSLNAATGGTASIVGPNGQVLIIANTGSISTGALGTISANGTFSVSAPGATINGSVDAPTTTVSGTILVPNQPPVNFSGLAATTARTDRLINLSSRVRIGPDAGRTLITGFVIGGGAPKRVLLRAVGPALTAFGVQGALSNPRLQLYDGTGKLILENDDWSGADTATSTTQVGAFSLIAGSKDAALFTTLQPGAYTMHVIDGGETGVALAEIYDASGNPNSEYQRLVNISTRGEAGVGENVLIGGFIVTGNSPKRVLVRGIGPGLTAFGLSGTLADPRLRVYRNGELIGENDNWSGGTAEATAAVVQAALDTGAFVLTAGSKDSALILTLAPGNYTAQVAADDGASTGTALVEIYEIP